jgi:putative exporter of polyketide antibiotics
MPNEPITHDPRQEADAKRNEALARYDAHPGIAITLLVVMALIVGVATYQLVADRDVGDGYGAPHPAPHRQKAK